MTWPSPDAFVKTLGSSNDVELAISAWNNEDMYIPSKGQFIASWALKNLLKNKQSQLDERIWILLESILLSKATPPPWLSTVLFKTPVVPILTAILRRCTNKDADPYSKNMLASCQRVLGEVLPLVYPRTRFETTLECFWAALEASSENINVKLISKLIKLAVEGLRMAFVKATNKAKIYQSFLDDYFVVWIKADNATVTLPHLQELIWSAANDILWSLEALRLTLHPSTDGQNAFFDKLRNACHMYPPTYDILPRLFRDHLRAITVHRSSLTQLGVEAAAYRIYSYFSSICRDNIDDGARAQLDLIHALETDVGSIRNDNKWEMALISTVQSCVERLGSSKGNHITNLIVEILVALGLMDYSLLIPHTEDLLRYIAFFDGSNEPAGQLRELIISYHSKTRTLDQLCNHILSTIAAIVSMPRIDVQPSCEPHSSTNRLLNGCLFGLQASSSLSLAIARFVTPGQVDQIANSITLNANSSIKNVQATLGGARATEMDNACVTSVLIIRLATFAIPFLPGSTNSDSELLAMSERVQSLVISPALILAKFESTLPNLQLFVTSTLQFFSSLIEDCVWFQPQQQFGGIEFSYWEDILASEEYSAWLKLELVRVLVHFASNDEIIAIFQHILHQIRETGPWDGNVTSLNEESLSTAYWSMLTERYLAVFVHQSTQTQLEEFATSIIATYVPTYFGADMVTITPPKLLDRLFGNASFWEHERLQGVILGLIVEKTDKLISMESETVESNSQMFTMDMRDIEELARGSMAPLLARRAILLEMAISRLPESQRPVNMWTEGVLRAFASRRLYDDNPSFRKFCATPQVILFLSTSSCTFAGDAYVERVFNDATKRILEVAFPIYLKTERPPTQLISDLQHIFSFSDDPQRVIVDSKPWEHEFWSCLLRSIADWHKSASDLPPAVINSISAITSRLRVALQKYLGQLPEACDGLPSSLKLFRAFLNVEYALSNNDDGIVELCISTILPLLQCFNGSREMLQSSYLEILWLLVDGIQNDQEKVELITKLVSVYHVAASELGINDPLDVPLRRAIKLLTVESFQSSLDLMHETLAYEEFAAWNLIHISTVFLKDAPEGTFRIAQAAFARNLSSFNEMSLSWDHRSTALQHHVLLQVLHVCQDKPAFIRPYEAGSIFTILARLSQPSSDSMERTHVDVFHTIVKAASALIRNRRDLVVHLLPHLTVVLCNLIGHFRAAKPNLGRKQRGMVSNSLPPWIALSQPLGTQEASILARLLVALTSKTVVRSKSNTISHDGEYEAQSIAKPFGKHASCVIGAYIDVVNDPLCLLGRDVRSELAPGLHALCGMSGERGRDALMPTLDSGGKMILKLLWSSFETQRYSGQG